MKRALFLLSALCSWFSTQAQDDFDSLAAVPRSSAVAPSYTIAEDFEELNSGGALGSATDGYDSTRVSAKLGWVTNNYTPALVGNYSLQLTNPNTASAMVRWTLVSNSTWSAYFRFKLAEIPAAHNPYLFHIYPYSGGSPVGSVRLLTTAKLRAHNGSATADTVATLSANTEYHCFFNWSTNGTASAGFTTDGTYPTGNNIASVSGGNGVLLGSLAHLETSEGSVNQYVIFDTLRVSSNSILSAP